MSLTISKNVAFRYNRRLLTLRFRMSTLLQRTPWFDEQLARLAALLSARQAQIFTAESCTGGLLAALLTARPGASQWFGGGMIPYSNALKRQYLGVKERTLQVFGAVSEATVGEMALGLPLRPNDVGVAISGIAGPDGGSTEKPVGMVCFAIAYASALETFTAHFPGDRDAVRAASVAFVIGKLVEIMEDSRKAAGNISSKVPGNSSGTTPGKT